MFQAKKGTKKMTAKKDKNGYWFFFGEIKGEKYFYDDCDNFVSSKKEALKLDIEIQKYLATGNLSYISPQFRYQLQQQNYIQQELIKEGGEYPSMWWVYIITEFPIEKTYV